jgi:hypothetical protein
MIFPKVFLDRFDPKNNLTLNELIEILENKY